MTSTPVPTNGGMATPAQPTGPARRPRVVVIGGGFGGLQAAKALQRLPVDVTLIDRRNFHLFQPLVYQVATGALSPAEVAVPLRWIFRSADNVRVLLGDVTDVALDRREVVLRPPADGPDPVRVPYDTLIVSGGSSYSYFGHDEWREVAPEVKSLESALDVRRRILAAFEAAEVESRPDAAAAWLTFVVVGAGPTGVEMAGQIAELGREALAKDFRGVDPRRAQILLLELADRILGSFPPSLSRKAARSLEELGVGVLTDHRVVDIDPGGVTVETSGGQTRHIPARTVVWAAGVEAAPLAGVLRRRPARRSTAPAESPSTPTSRCPAGQRCSPSATWCAWPRPAARASPCPVSLPSRCSRAATPRAWSPTAWPAGRRRRSATWTRGTWRPSDAPGRSPTCGACG